MDGIRIPKGAEVFIGAPASPLHKNLVDPIAELVKSQPGIVEAHLPQMYIPGHMTSAAQVLVIVTADSQPSEHLMEHIGEGLRCILPAKVHLDVWPLTNESDILDSVRSAGCQLGVPGQLADDSSIRKPWWRFW